MRETARAREVRVNGTVELVVTVRGRTYVASRSNPGYWWEATHDWCACPLATLGRKYCRHQKAVSAWNKARAEEQKAA